MQPQALPANPQAYAQLSDKLASLSLPRVQGQATSTMATQWSGKTFKLEPNALHLEDISLAFGNESSTLTVSDDCGEHLIQVGHGAWLKGTVDGADNGVEPIAACGGWTAAETYDVRVCYTEREVGAILRFHNGNGELQMEVEPSVSWGSTEIKLITGRL